MQQHEHIQERKRHHIHRTRTSLKNLNTQNVLLHPACSRFSQLHITQTQFWSNVRNLLKVDATLFCLPFRIQFLDFFLKMRNWIIYTLFDKSINETDFTKTFMSSVFSFRRIKTLIDGKIKSVISFCFFIY